MKQIKKLLALLAMLCMVLSLCACGGDSDVQDNEDDVNVENVQNDNDTDEDADTDADETTATFKVTVVDQNGNPVQGAIVQLCKDTCVPMSTDTDGIATFSTEIVEGHKLSIMSCPEGYTFVQEDIYLDAGITEYTLTVEATQ